MLVIGGALTAFLWIRRPREWPWDPVVADRRPAGPREHRSQPRTHRGDRRGAHDRRRADRVRRDLRQRLQGLVPGCDRPLDHQRPDHPGPELRIGSRGRGRRRQQVPGVKTASGLQFTEAKINNGGTDIVNGVDPATFARGVPVRLAERRLEQPAAQPGPRSGADRGAVRQVPRPVARATRSCSPASTATSCT